MINGFDASEFQTSVDFATAKQAGYDFDILRAVMGATGRDPDFQARVKASEDAGLITLAYGFAYVKTSTATQEADAICAVADKAGGLHGLVLDTEGAGVPSDVSVAELTQYILDWSAMVQKHGYQPICYMNVDFLRNRVDVAKLKHLPLWQAEYGVSQPTVVGGWQPTFWQKSQSGHVPGVSGNVDLDVFFGTLADLQNLCKKKRT